MSSLVILELVSVSARNPDTFRDWLFVLGAFAVAALMVAPLVLALVLLVRRRRHGR